MKQSKPDPKTYLTMQKKYGIIPAKVKVTIDREKERQTHIKLIKEKTPDIKNILFLGARHDSEILSFIDNGFTSKGIDCCIETQHIIQGDATNLEDYFAKNEFDLVYACLSLEHMYDINKTLAGIKKISKRGLFAVLPLTRTTSRGHPTCFSVMEKQPKTLDDECLKDFDIFKPLTVEHYSINENIVLFITYTSAGEI